MGNSNNTVQPYDQLGYLLMQVSFLKQRLVNSALRPLDITYVQFVILAGVMELSENGSMVTQQSIASERCLDKAMVSNVVKTLIDKHLLAREVHPSDKRAYTLRLTEEGRTKAVKGKQTALDVDSVFFRDINKGEFQESLEKLLIQNS